MEVIYTNSRKDLFAFTLGHYARAKGTWIMLALLVLGTLPSTLNLLDASSDLALRIATAAVLEFLIVVPGIVVWLVIVTLALLFQRKVGILTEHTVRIDPEAISESTHVNSARHLWVGVARVRKWRNLLVIYVGPGIAHVIPRRAFATNQEWDEFASTATQYWRAASA